jgi:hypothetical protein
MKPQKPAQGILLTRDFGDSKQYEVTCECGDGDHSHKVWVEADDGNVSVTIYTTTKSKWWERNRWKQIWTLLTKGYVECEADVIMNQQQALNYAETLKLAVKDSEEFRKKRNA